MKRDVLFPFGRRIFDGEIVAIEDVTRGLKCGCVCVGCGSPLIARHGTEKDWHFSHAKGANCADGYERSVHELAKQFLLRASHLFLPKHLAFVSAHDTHGQLLTDSEVVCDEELSSILDVELGVNLGTVTSDAKVHTDRGVFLLEIQVFHQLSEDKYARLVKTGLPVLGLNLSKFQTRRPASEDIVNALQNKTPNIRWVFHPRFHECLNIALGRLQTNLAAVNSEWDLIDAASPNLALRQLSKFRRDEKSLQATSRKVELNELDWRASLPSPSEIEVAATQLANESGAPVASILALTGAIRKRSELVGKAPEDILLMWQDALNLPKDAVLSFMRHAGYLF